MRLTAKCEHGERAIDVDSDLTDRYAISDLLRDVLLACPRCQFDAQAFLPPESAFHVGPLGAGGVAR